MTLDGISGWSVDTRTLAPGDLYFALRGPSHDGHDYVEQAIQKGAAGVVVDHPIEGVRNAMVVPDTLRALQSMAREADRTSSTPTTTWPARQRRSGQ